MQAQTQRNLAHMYTAMKTTQRLIDLIVLMETRIRGVLFQHLLNSTWLDILAKSKRKDKINTSS